MRLVPSKQIEHKDRLIRNQRKQIEDLKAQLSQSCPRTEPAALRGTEDSSAMEKLVKEFETLKVSVNQLNEELEGKKMLIGELQKQIHELNNFTPIGAEDLDIQVRHLVRILTLVSRGQIYAKVGKLGEVAEQVDDLIMHYKWPYRNEERFEEMKAISANLKEMGFPTAMHAISFDNKEMTAMEKEWVENIQNK